MEGTIALFFDKNVSFSGWGWKFLNTIQYYAKRLGHENKEGKNEDP